MNRRACTRVCVGLGSNLGDRQAHLQWALQMIADLPQVFDLQVSPLYQSKALDCPEPLPFLNAVLAFDTWQDAHTLLRQLQDIEQRRGRRRSYPNAPRTLDLDILCFGAQVCHDAELTLPHPRMHQRLFVLRPMAALAGQWRHPELGQDVNQMVAALKQLDPEQSEPEAIGELLQVAASKMAGTGFAI